MDDDFPMILARAEKRSPDPDQVMRVLPVDGNPRPETRMGKKVIPFDMMGLQSPKEGLVLCGNALHQSLLQAFKTVVTGEGRNVDPIAYSSRIPTIRQPCLCATGVLEETKKHLFMVAEHTNQLKPIERRPNQPVNDRFASWSTIDIITKKDQQLARFRGGCGVSGNRKKQLFQ